MNNARFFTIGICTLIVFICCTKKSFSQASGDSADRLNISFADNKTVDVRYQIPVRSILDSALSLLDDAPLKPTHIYEWNDGDTLILTLSISDSMFSTKQLSATKTWPATCGLIIPVYPADMAHTDIASNDKNTLCKIWYAPNGNVYRRYRKQRID